MNILKFIFLGFVLSLLYPPYFLLPLGFLIFTYLCLLCDNYSKNKHLGKLFLSAYFFSFGFFLSFFFWIKNPFLVYAETKNLFLLFILLIIILSAISAIIFTIFLHYNKIISTFIAIPLAFTLIEFSFSKIFYGFPWITSSLILSNNIFLLNLVKYQGTLFSSYVLIQLFCLPYYLFFNKKNKIIIFYFLITCVLPLSFSIFFNLNLNNKVSNSNDLINFEIHQMNIPVIQNKSEKEKTLNEIYKKIYKSNSDLLIFSENNFPFLVADKNLTKIQEKLKNNQIVIIGGTRFEENKYFNSLFTISKTEIKIFDKQILVPFGEFLPFRKYLNFLVPISGNNDFTSGKKTRSIQINNEITFIPIICYEIIFYWKLINNYNYDNNLIINITNDIWFGKYLGPYQHFYHTKIRAAEFNKPIIRVSNNGISGLIDNTGDVISKSKLNTKKIIKGKYKFQNKNNFYLTHYYLNIYLLTIILVLIIINFTKKNYAR